MSKSDQNPFHSIKLIALEKYFDEMVKLYNSGTFPKVLLLNGKKGIGKFTLTFHFLNYIYSINEKNHYNLNDKLIDSNSKFYNSILNQTCADVIFLKAEEGKNIKIDDIRKLKSILTTSSLSDNPRFTIIDEVEYLNVNSANALLKTLEEPGKNNFFILINNQQTDLIETISSRCLKNNIYLNLKQQKEIINYFVENKKLETYLYDSHDLTPGFFLKYNELHNKYKVDIKDNIYLKINKLLHGYKKDKDKAVISMTIFLIEKFFFILIKNNVKKIDMLINLKLSIVKKINDFIIYNLNISTVLHSIELKLRNVR
jgi:DNA polymerase-3 subunit delta'